MNCQSIVLKKKQIGNFVGDLGNSSVYGFSETWLKEEDSQSFWELKKDIFITFRSDRETMLKDRGGGVMLIVPKSLNPKIKKDLNHLNKNLFENLWIECNLNNNAHNKKSNSSASTTTPKSSIDSFLEEVSTSIDFLVTENKPITLKGDFNIDYLNWKEKQCLDSVIVPYGLSVINENQPTKFKEIPAP